jgi:catechol 2,3-dioxygenase-like lactoylglutathione lyase family enzyme
MQMAAKFDRAQEDVGNIVEFGHVNVLVPDQRLATLFYVTGLGLTRDPYLMTGTEIMWANAGTTQFHLPGGPAQVLPGTVGLVVPDLEAVSKRLAAIAPMLAGTQFRVSREADAIVAVCPWGNRIRCYAPGPRWPGLALGIAYVEFKTRPGTAERIARFYREVLLVPTHFEAGRTSVPAGMRTQLLFTESDAAEANGGGGHIQIALANFSAPHAWLVSRGLITQESNAHQYRFEDVVDVESGELLFKIEHEVRSMRHPLFARALVNRNSAQSPQHYAVGHETQPWSLAPNNRAIADCGSGA